MAFDLRTRSAQWLLVVGANSAMLDAERLVHGPPPDDAPEGQAKLRAVKAELRQRLHSPLPEQGAYLRSVILGHTRYYGVPIKSGTRRFPQGCGTPVVDGSAPSQSREPPALAPHDPSGRAVAPVGSYLPPLSSRASGRPHPRWEPDAVMPLVRICGGGHEQSSTPTPTFSLP